MCYGFNNLFKLYFVLIFERNWRFVDLTYLVNRFCGLFKLVCLVLFLVSMQGQKKDPIQMDEVFTIKEILSYCLTTRTTLEEVGLLKFNK